MLTSNQMECLQINVVGGSGAKSPATVSIPGAYKATDPGILVNIYQSPQPAYTIPGMFSDDFQVVYKLNF